MARAVLRNVVPVAPRVPRLGLAVGGRGGKARVNWPMRDELHMWSRATLHRAMQDNGFPFSPGPNQYVMAGEKTLVRKQRSNFIDTVRKYREAERTILSTDETRLNRNMSTYRNWNHGSTDASVKVLSGKNARIIVAHVGPRNVRRSDGASWIFIESKQSSDYSEMNSTT